LIFLDGNNYRQYWNKITAPTMTSTLHLVNQSRKVGKSRTQVSLDMEYR
jgi:hypothetical protein